MGARDLRLLVRVVRHDEASAEVNMREHHALAGDQATGELGMTSSFARSASGNSGRKDTDIGLELRVRLSFADIG
jgi:hypothetical protein